MADPNEATEPADQYHRHEPDPSKWDEAVAVTGRPNDIPLSEPDDDLPEVLRNSTLAARAEANKRRSKKVVDESENKAVQAAETKKPARRSRAKK